MRALAPVRALPARLAAGAATLGLVAVLAVAPVAAESPGVVAEQLAIDGAYVAPERRDVDERPLIEQTNRARALGLKLVVVVPNDPQPDPRSFARRILEASTADVALVFPPGGGLEASVIDEYRIQNARALAAARSKSDPAAATESYAAELLAAPPRAVPSIVTRTMLAVVVLATVLGVSVVIEQAIRRTRHRDRPRATAS